MELKHFKFNILILFLAMLCISNNLYADKTYFDLSQDEINIKTNFTGQELILFGIVEPGNDVIMIVKGPKKDFTVRNKKRILGFWFNTKSVLYEDIPSVFFISSSNKINEILNEKDIFKEKLSFDSIQFVPVDNKDLFINLTEWNESLIRIQKQNNLFKEFDLKIILPNNFNQDYIFLQIFQQENTMLIFIKLRILKYLALIANI